MSKHIIVFYLTILLFIFYSTIIQAQQGFLQIVLNAGTGYSPGFNGDSPIYPVGISLNAYGDHQPGPGFKCSAITPLLGGTIDIGLIKNFSIGFAYSYQSEIATWWLPNMTPPFYSDKVTRTNLALRFLYHLPLNKIRNHFDFYLGIRFGQSYWYDTPSQINFGYSPTNPLTFISSNSSAINDYTPSMVVYSFQLLFGLRYYPIKCLGIHLELGLGSPYIAEGGLTLRINTRKSKHALSPTESYGGHEGK